MQEATSTLGQEETVPSEIEDTELAEQELPLKQEEMATEATIPETEGVPPTVQDETALEIAPSHSSRILIPMVSCRRVFSTFNNIDPRHHVHND